MISMDSRCVIFAGGLGTRMQEETDTKPKPMVLVDGEPMLIWVIRNYARAGVSRFVILLGYKGGVVDDYFRSLGLVEYSRDYEIHGKSHYTIVDRGRTLEITLLNTGLDTPTGGRLLQARNYVGEMPFFCSYGDALSDINISNQWKFYVSKKMPFLVSVAQQRSRFGEVVYDNGSKIMKEFYEKPLMANMVNIGYFIFRDSIFDLCKSELMMEQVVLSRMSQDSTCVVFEHLGYWQPIDSLRDLNIVKEQSSQGLRQWDVAGTE